MRFVLCLACLGSLMSSAFAVAQDFRVDTEVFAGDGKQPIAETLTIFAEGRVYDFLLGNSPEIREIAIFDPGRGRFTLLDPARTLQCTIANQELLAYVLDLNKDTIAQKAPLFVAAADPQFEIHAEPAAGQGGQTKVTLASKLITYSAIGKTPPQAQAVDAFKQFADWYARLNASRGGGSLPPGARLVLNRELAERKLLPEEIVRVTNEPGIGKKLEVRSRHAFNWALGVADRQKIEQAGDHLANFQAVSFSEYRTPASKPAAEKTTKR